MAEKKKTERQVERKVSKKKFNLSIPKPLDKDRKEEGKTHATSLFVDKKTLFEDVNFAKSEFSDQVLTTRDTNNLLSTIFKNGDIGRRFGEGGLEDDPSKQQVIVYTMIVCQRNLLWYQRALRAEELISEQRLQGRISIGFGGHKTKDDILISRDELVFLEELMPVVKDEVGTILGMNKGLFSEVKEEVGLGRGDVKDMKLLGAFFDGRFEDPLSDIQVGWVHTGIVAVLEVDPVEVDKLTFRKNEVEKAWWVPFGSVKKEFRETYDKWHKGKGPKVESWTEIVIREFWPDYLSSR